MAGRKQFDVDDAVERAMLAFWRHGFQGTSLDDLVVATGLHRSSLYNAFGDKEALFLRCLDRYASRYGDRYRAALAHEDDPVGAVEAFYRVTLDRIADPGVPAGCFAAQTTIAAQSLPAAIAARALDVVGSQRVRLRALLTASSIAPDRVEPLSFHLVGVNQSLAVLSTGLATGEQLESMVGTALDVLRRALL